MSVSYKGSFLVNQYKSPLLLSIGQGINSIAFVESNNSYRDDSNNIMKMVTISEDDSNSEGSDLKTIVETLCSIIKKQEEKINKLEEEKNKSNNRIYKLEEEKNKSINRINEMEKKKNETNNKLSRLKFYLNK